MSLSEKIAVCREEYQRLQFNAVLEYLNAVSPLLLARASTSRSVEDVKSALDAVNKMYEAGNDLLRASLEKTKAGLEKEYQKRMKANVDCSGVLDIDLLLNSNEGGKELILPVKRESVGKGSLVDRLCDAATNLMLGVDMTCDEKDDFAGYVRIVSKDVASKPEMNQLSAKEITDHLVEKLPGLKEVNITLNVVCGNIKMNGYVPSEKSEVRTAPVRRSKYFAGDLSGVIENFVCVSIPEASDYLEITGPNTLDKVKRGHLHGLQRGMHRHTYVPMHDLITYMFNHQRLKQEKPTGSHAFSMSMVELDDEQLAKYKSEVGEVRTVKESAVALGVTADAVYNMLDKSQLHGVKHKNQWYIPKVELEFVKYLRDREEESK